jgi:hypothetical protein
MRPPLTRSSIDGSLLKNVRELPIKSTWIGLTAAVDAAGVAATSFLQKSQPWVSQSAIVEDGWE